MELLCAVAVQLLIRDGFRLFTGLTMAMIVALDHLKSMSVDALQTLLQQSSNYREMTLAFSKWCDGLIASRLLNPEMAVDFNAVGAAVC